MTVDSEQHREFLLQIINAMQIPGQHIALAYEVLQALKAAAIVEAPK